MLLAFVTGASIGIAEPDLWPTYRHDASRSGISPIAGGFEKAPRVAWKFDLGGEMAPLALAYDIDVDQDGTAETILTTGTNVICQDARGSERWKVSDLPQAKLIHTADFHGTGRKHLLIETNNQRERGIHCIDSRTGKCSQLFTWHSAFASRVGVGQLMRKGRHGKEQFYALWDGWNPSGNGQIMHFYLFTADPETYEPELIHHITKEGGIFGAQFVVADADGSGTDDLIIISMEQAWVFDMASGVYRSDQDFATVDLDGDGRMEAIIGGGNGILFALEESNGKCRILWQVRLSDRRIGSPVIADVDGDGGAEIIVPDEGGTVFCLRTSRGVR